MAHPKIGLKRRPLSIFVFYSQGQASRRILRNVFGLFLRLLDCIPGLTEDELTGADSSPWLSLSGAVSHKGLGEVTYACPYIPKFESFS